MSMPGPAKPDALRERIVRSADGVGLYVREWGDPHGPEILLIHGQAQCHLCFARQVDSPAMQRFRMVAFDLRGHGASDKPLEPGFYRDGRAWADDVAAVIEATGLLRPVVVGWSLGGRVLRQYLMHHGDARLSGINFLSTRPIEDPRVVGPGSAAYHDGGTRDFRGRLEADIQFLRDCYAEPPEGQELLLAVAYNMAVPRQVRDAIGGWHTDPAASIAALNAVKVPTLVTHGRRDKLILPEAAEMTAAAVGTARVSWYDNCGHSPFYEDAARYNRELEAFAAANWRT